VHPTSNLDGDSYAAVALATFCVTAVDPKLNYGPRESGLPLSIPRRFTRLFRRGASRAIRMSATVNPFCRDEAAVGPDREVTSYNRFAPEPIVAVRPRTYKDS
jgi:hypothetical protein